MKPRAGVAWQGAKADLFEEAMRVVPAIAKHRANTDLLLVNATYLAYQRLAGDLGVSITEAWTVLISAYAVWVQNLFELQADESGLEVNVVIDTAIASSVDWVADRG